MQTMQEPPHEPVRLSGEQLVRLMELQRRLLDLVARGGPLPERLGEACRLFESFVPGAMATVMRLGPSGRLHFASAPSVPAAVQMLLDGVVPGPDSGSCACAAWTGEPAFVSDAREDPRWASLRDVAAEHGIGACWSAPVRLQSREVAGTFALTSFERRLPDMLHRQLMELGAGVAGLLFDQAAEHERQESEGAELRRMALVASRVPVGVAITDLDGRIQWVNEGFRSLGGLGDEDLLGHLRSEVMLGERTDHKALQALHEAIAACQPFAGMLVDYRRDGGFAIVQVASTPRRDAAGRCEGALLVETDVTASRRLADFNALLAEVTECASAYDDAVPLLQRVCELAVAHAGLCLAWVGQPGPDGWFEFLASAGPAIGYMEGLRISADPALPEGGGSSGRTWREGGGYYNRSFAHAGFLAPWRERAARFAIGASATLPIRRGGRMWAVLTVYHLREDMFDAELRTVLEAIAGSISRGLDRLDLVHREREIQALNQSMLDSTTVGVLLLRERVVARANERAAQLLGAAGAQALLGTRAIDLYADRAQGEAMPGRIAEAFAKDGRAVMEVAARRLDGDQVWLRIEGAPFPRTGFDQIWTLVDISGQHEALASQALLARALASVKEGVIITDAEQRTVYVNRAFETITGYGPDDILGRNCNLLQGELTDPGMRARITARLVAKDSFEGEILNYRKDGRSFWNLLAITPLRDEAGQVTHFVGVQRNIDEIRALRDRLEYLAFHDDLTGLPNRRELDRHLPGAIAAAQAARRALAVGKIDLDDFKVVNESFGPSRGDQLLQQLSQRIRQRLAPGEFLARVGGDEFVVVLSGRGSTFADDELDACARRLGEAFADPVSLAPGLQVEVSQSMGIALFPDDGAEGGLLLRNAEEALYQCKQNRRSRRRWWLRHGTTPAADAHVEQSIAAYGEEASRLLRKLVSQTETVQQTFIEEFYRRLGDEPHSREILEGLAPADLALLRERQGEHLRRLAGGDLSWERLQEESRRLGRIHALVGVDGAQLMYWMAVYRDMLSAHFNAQPMLARERYQVVQLLDQRIRDDMQIQLQAQAETNEQFVEMVMQALPASWGSWTDAMGSELAQLARMPGIACALVLRQSSEGVFSVEASDGPLAPQVTSLFAAEGGEIGPLRPPADSLLIRAWQSGRVHASASLVRSTRVDSWGELDEHMLRLGIRAGAHLPVLDAQGQPVALLVVLGRFPRQFGGTVMQQFTRNLQQRWSEIWQRGTRPPPPVSQEQAVAYRRRLFEGGLQMAVQPIVDLRDGRLAKVEALARLVLEDGTMVGPDVFIPLLRQAELDRLFVRGLDLALAALGAWQAEGLVVDVSINLPPLTLAEPACASWVAQALATHRVAPHRLVLEVLETQQFDELVRDENVQRLLDLGVQLAMDDLGSGYSSLRRLASLPFSAIKVDQDLLKRLRIEPAQTISLVSAVIQMGRDFGCDVVVEGLEDAGMIEVARLLGARYGQGYGLARPMPVEALPCWHRETRMPDLSAPLSTRIGAVAFQWWSIRHRSLHAATLDACPMSVLLAQLGDAGQAARVLHDRQHAEPHNSAVARDLLDALEALVRSRLVD
ncbi:EAL domain-containing protein [Dyella ginsengisoli]|uniref:EAL domain-containing protein n=1 Tax=Dyella ginsengisoli TaxID=363848 RepID=UPI0018E2630B|nr:EAL domain-containing protein [Dyella ginsengisoli]